MDGWQRLLDGEREDIRLALQETFGEDIEMTFDFAGYFLRVHRQDKELAAHELICRECRIAREQVDLQAVPSYVEREANQKEEVYNDIQS